jgi:transposase
MSAHQGLASNTVIINARCSLRIEADQREIIVAGYCADDAVAEAYAWCF